MFGASQLCGKIGCYNGFKGNRPPPLGPVPALIIALHKWKALVSKHPRRAIPFTGPRKTDLVLFTGEFRAELEPR